MFVIVRTISDDIWAGDLERRHGQEVTLINAIRIQRLSKDRTSSEIAMLGVQRSDEYKFQIPVNKIVLLQAIEILATTEEAEESIKSIYPTQKV